MVKKNSDITIVLEGHADERGTREYNLALGDEGQMLLKII